MSVIELVKTRRPVVHCITNYVTAESVANALLAAGASPIMTDDPEEVADVDRIADAVCLNLGTWSRSRERAILTSAKAARGRGIPIALDPVGVGASDVRLETARRLIFDIGVDIIRGNSSEIATLAGHTVRAGIDASASSDDASLYAARELARSAHAVVAVTGATDIVANADTAYAFHGGSAMMKYVTGVGCRLTALSAAYAACVGIREGALYAVAAMDACGKIAEAETARGRAAGVGTFAVYLNDAIFNLTENDIKELVSYEILP